MNLSFGEKSMTKKELKQRLKELSEENKELKDRLLKLKISKTMFFLYINETAA